MDLSNLPNIPHEPGCYLYKDNKGTVIYVGKAKDLNKRVKSYFQKEHEDEKTRQLVLNIDSMDFIVTRSEVEALILENNLIKKHNPKYNISLKDSKRYAYIEITDEEFPRLLIARKRENLERCYGPFVSGEKRDYVMKTLIRGFKIRTCKKLPKKACLRYHIGLCDAPCISNISREEYVSRIKIVESILKGNIEDIKKSLEDEMKTESMKLNYEKALELRNQVEAIEWLSEKQTMERKKEYNEDVVNYIIKENHVYLILFNIYNGILENKQEYDFSYTENFFEEFLVQYYSENPIPREIIVPNDVEEALIQFLEEKKGSKVIMTVPEKGDKKQLLELVKKNVEIVFFGEFQKLEELKNVLNLQEIPIVIECFDISHLTGTSVVGSMVQFRNGKPDKSNYRRFKIRTVDKIDDFASIKEIVFRRYYKLKMEKLDFPDLIIIDGGKGQLSSAIDALKELEIKIPIISIAKEFEEIYTPESKESIKLERKNKALQLVQAIRDEAHRFAINYNRLLRGNSFFE